jgi:hypothetical protein
VDNVSRCFSAEEEAGCPIADSLFRQVMQQTKEDYSKQAFQWAKGTLRTMEF